jgi:redox-sensitive bicupin YhaK (pirin superfamily)
MDPGARFALPTGAAGSNRMLYFFAGESMKVAGRSVPGGTGLELRADVEVTLENGTKESELLMLQGRPIAEPVVQYGPFVMNTRAEIEKAYSDYRRTGFGGWPWPKNDPVHDRDARFARHADGQIERAG